MRKLWFITRSYPPQTGGGPQTIKLQVDFLSKYYDVSVVTINHESHSNIICDHIIYLSKGRFFRVFSRLSALGLWLDDLFFWRKNALNYLKNKIDNDDIIFTTTGGEISCFNLGKQLVKYKPSLKLILNYHDGIDHAIYDTESVYQ
eukprot:COSAG01_NODE_755_length_13819_cov_130.671939_1_plen_145_part_10